MKKDGMHAWTIGNLMYVASEKKPMDAADVIFHLKERNLHSESVTQDVLIRTGREDQFIPFKMHDKEVQALTNVTSVTPEVFTNEEHAQNHCQIGNICLARDAMVQWICETLPTLSIEVIGAKSTCPKPASNFNCGWIAKCVRRLTIL